MFEKTMSTETASTITRSSTDGYPAFEHGTRDDHVATLRRAKDAGVRSIWSGDIRRNAYLRENLAFAEREGFVRLTEYESDQESGWDIEWLSHPEIAG